MTTAVPDREKLAQGKLVLLREDDPDFCSARVNLWRYGVKLADDSTWRQWRRFRWVELWQAVALQLFLDPDTVQWHSLGRFEPKPRATRSRSGGPRKRSRPTAPIDTH